MIQQSIGESIIAFWDTVFTDSGAWMLIFSGLMALIWFFYEGVRRGWIRRKKDDWELDSVSRFLKFLIFIGIALGLVTIVTAVMTMIRNFAPSYAYAARYPDKEQAFDLLTSISLLVMGLAMFIKPLQDVPIATIVGLVAGAAVALLLTMIIPDDLLGSSWVKWVIVGIFVLITSVIGALLKVWVDGIEAVAKLLSWPPVALIIAAYCITQGLFVLIGGQTLILLNP